jgi:hypothetical protein
MWLDSHLPANINDEDIYFGMEDPIQEPPEGTFTDMTYSLVLAGAQSVARMLAFRDFIEPGKKTMVLRKQILKDFQDRVSTLLRNEQPLPSTDSYNWDACAHCNATSLPLLMSPETASSGWLPIIYRSFTSHTATRPQHRGCGLALCGCPGMDSQSPWPRCVSVRIQKQ